VPRRWPPALRSMGHSSVAPVCAGPAHTAALCCLPSRLEPRPHGRLPASRSARRAAPHAVSRTLGATGGRPHRPFGYGRAPRWATPAARRMRWSRSRVQLPHRDAAAALGRPPQAALAVQPAASARSSVVVPSTPSLSSQVALPRIARYMGTDDYHDDVYQRAGQSVRCRRRRRPRGSPGWCSTGRRRQDRRALAAVQGAVPSVRATRRRLATTTQASSARPMAVSMYQIGSGPCA
jgi:hypothetical protein